MRRGLLLVVLIALLAPMVGDAAPTVSGWLTFANSPARTNFVPEQSVSDPSALQLIWTAQVEGAVTAQPLVLRDVPNPGDRTIYVVTSKGLVYGLNQNGFAIAKRQLGHERLSDCDWLPENDYGITGTPTIDPASGTMYLVDALGYLHALDPITLEDRAGWPVRLYDRPRRELAWGAVTLAKGRLYVGTGLLCSRASGRIYSIDAKTRRVLKWTAVPLKLGGGGGLWGWGGVAYDARTASILAVTGDALPGGKNSGERFRESAAYAEHLVQLRLDLSVRASHSPVDYRNYVDQDLTGTPVVMRASGCPPLVAAQGKNGFVYVWRLDRIARGLVWRRRLAPKLNGQPAWSPLTRSLYVVGHTRAYRLQLTGRCTFRTAWSIPLPTDAVNGPPLITNNVIWFTVSEDHTLWAVDAESGEVLWKGGLAEPAFAPPTIVDGRVYAAAFLGLVVAFG